MIRTKLFAVAAVSLLGLVAAEKSHAQWGGYNPVVGGTIAT